ncbi:MAG TPA: hypothetical protein DD473_24255 [Planctomycetaceae bacterium]|nr:hypothetical protein [Planctomycetaceae bacterium]|tara:strand:- start:287 stop:466 length:180 start_codon:yes stop_codon:yes gene_type:complete
MCQDEKKNQNASRITWGLFAFNAVFLDGFRFWIFVLKSHLKFLAFSMRESSGRIAARKI